MTIRLYGIPNCDTVRKARAHLAQIGVSHAFHDYRKDGVPAADLARWIERLGWEALVNRRGPTWRKLGDTVQASVVDGPSALAVMVANPSVIRRPVVVEGDTLVVGYDAAQWGARFG